MAKDYNGNSSGADANLVLFLQIIGYDANGSNGKPSGAHVNFNNRR